MDSSAVEWSGAKPMAILQTGENPLWFQLTEDGPVHIESIEDAIFSAAFIPWPLALHVRFFLEREDELIMAVNREGFIKITPNDAGGLAIYRFSGGNLWRQYTVGGFVFYNGLPNALLYLDNFFLDSDSSPVQQRTWSFNMESNILFPLNIPALEHFPAEEGWSADAMRLGSDGLFYYRVRKNDSQPVTRIFRTDDLAKIGDEITAEVFFNSIQYKTEIDYSLLPQLPKGFFYTGIGKAGDSLVAFWEEQEEFFIGAAGFMVKKIE